MSKLAGYMWPHRLMRAHNLRHTLDFGINYIRMEITTTVVINTTVEKSLQL